MRFYTFTVLPFGLTSAPYVFTKTLRPLVKHWRKLVFFLVLYLDDGWCRAPDEESCSIIAKKVKSDLISAGLVPNCEKSVWVATQQLQWLGLLWNSKDGYLQISHSRIQDIIESINSLISSLPKTSARKLASVTGKIVSTFPVLGNTTKLMTRFLHHEIIKRTSWDDLFNIPSSSLSINELFFWKSKFKIPVKRDFAKYLVPHTFVFSDASSTGCGAFILGSDVISNRTWDDTEILESSTWRELHAILYALISFSSRITASSVKVFTDNKNAVSIYQSGSMNLKLHVLSLAIHNFCRDRAVTLDVQWIPREENQLADEISRFVDWDDWGVSSAFFSFVDNIYGPHTVDRFADEMNSKLPKFNSRFWCRGSDRVDAFSLSWEGENNWIVPPLALVTKAIFHLVASKAVGTLVIPVWPSSSFWPILFSRYSSVRYIVSSVFEITDSRGVFIHGCNNRSLFGSDTFQAPVMVIRLDAR
ncbi:uncharacterized protein [Amphiura filiformis]|uniref:uncharacterized protein n=1 Tax=Amphiura filiformis TaxID=82378 RepID=UPI003B224962